MKKDIATATPGSTDRARKAALAEVKARADALDAPKAATLPTSPDVAPTGGAAPQGRRGRKAATPRPPKPAKAATKAKGRKKPLRPAPAATRAPQAKAADHPLSGLDAAAKVLAGSNEPMRVSDLVEAMEKKGLWKSKSSKTPTATISAAIIREIRDKDGESRFVKKDRGLFAAAGR